MEGQTNQRFLGSYRIEHRGSVDVTRLACGQAAMGEDRFAVHTALGGAGASHVAVDAISRTGKPFILIALSRRLTRPTIGSSPKVEGYGLPVGWNSAKALSQAVVTVRAFTDLKSLQQGRFGEVMPLW